MILRLAAQDFGKFQGRRFELAPVTVVYGPNEAGKTTFFDALFQALCRPSETKVMGKALKKRYGAGRKAEVELAGPFEIGEDEFLSLCAIRAGDLELDMAKDSPWMAKLKTGLFHGGLDPAALAAEFERRSSDWKTYLHSRELEALREKAAAHRRDLDLRRRERDGLLAREKGLAEGERRLEETRRLREAAQAEWKEAQAALAFEEKIDRRRRADEALAALDRWDDLEARLRELEAYREDRREEWEALSAASRDAAAKAQADKARRELQDEQSAKARAAQRTLEATGAFHVERSRLAGEVAAGLRASAPVSASAAPAAPAALAALLPLVAAAALAVSAPGQFRIPALAAGFALAVAVFAILRAQSRKRASAAAARTLAEAKDRFALGEMDLAARHGDAAGDLPRPALGDIATREGLLQALDRMAAEAAAWEGRIQAARRQAAEGEEAQAGLARAAAESREGEEKCRRAALAWLERHGVTTPEEYLVRVRKHAELREELARRSADAADADGAEAGRRELTRQLKDLDEEGVPRQGLDAAARQRLRQKARDAEARRERLSEESDALTARLALEAGEVRGTLGKLAGEIVRAEEELLDLDARIADKELDKRAAAVAHAIFREIGEGSDLLLSGLSRDLETMLGHILPGNRDVSLSGLDRKQIQAGDAGGGRRMLESLSTGTQDAVVLAAKLALALKIRGDGGVLVLDDPFLAMDRQREERALHMLQEFHVRHGWQIILLTKDAHLRDGMSRLFPGLKVLDLQA